MHEQVFGYLRKLKIEFINHSHPPVYTVEEASKYREQIKGMHCKNLFLEDSKRGAFYLLTTPADKSFRLNEVRKLIKAKKLSFAKPDKMRELIGLDPGSASPFGLLNDEENITTYLIDEEVWNSTRVSFHPNTNTMTLEMEGEDFRKFVLSLVNSNQILKIDES